MMLWTQFAEPNSCIQIFEASDQVSKLFKSNNVMVDRLAKRNEKGT